MVGFSWRKILSSDVQRRLTLRLHVAAYSLYRGFAEFRIGNRKKLPAQYIIWNSLPPAVRNIDTHHAFRRALSLWSHIYFTVLLLHNFFSRVYLKCLVVYIIFVIFAYIVFNFYCTLQFALCVCHLLIGKLLYILTYSLTNWMGSYSFHVISLPLFSVWKYFLLRCRMWKICLETVEFRMVLKLISYESEFMRYLD